MSVVSVVVPYYQQPEQLELMLRALEGQTWRDLEVVIADDGSALPARPSTIVPCTVVRQEDRGFRAAAARNLGARSASGEVLCFLDCDTIPQPDYIERAIDPVLANSRTLVVGRREHRHLSGPLAGCALPSPQWLADGYARTDNLRLADRRSYRYVISAVLTMSRTLFDTVGGFDPTMTAYGGEDWDLGWRCWLAGALFQHVPDAVAVHDGPDFGSRPADPAVKATESAALARRITEASARPDGVVFRRTNLVADLSALEPGPAATVCAAQLLAGDASVLLPAPSEALVEDPRVYCGSIPADVRHAAEIVVRIHQPVDDPLALIRAAVAQLERSGGQPVEVLDSAGRPVMAVTSARTIAGVSLWGDAECRPRPLALDARLIAEDISLEARWARD